MSNSSIISNQTSQKIRAQFPIFNHSSSGNYSNGSYTNDRSSYQTQNESGLDKAVNKNADLVYLDSSATTQKPKVVIDTLLEYYSKYNSNVHRGVYKISEISEQLWTQSHKIVAKFLNCTPEEIVMVSNTTHAVNFVAMSYCTEYLSEGDVIAVNEMDHHSNMLPWIKAAELVKAKVEWIPITDSFEPDINYIDFLIRKYRSKLKLLATTEVGNVLGTRLPLKKIIEMCKKNGTKVFVDGAQAVSHSMVDVRKMDCDFYAFSGHKLYAPNGTGALYINSQIRESLKPFMYGGGQIKDVTRSSIQWEDSPTKFESGTQSIGEVVAFARAILWFWDTLEVLSADTSTEIDKVLTVKELCPEVSEGSYNDSTYGTSSSYSSNVYNSSYGNNTYSQSTNTNGQDLLCDKVMNFKVNRVNWGKVKDGYKKLHQHENTLIDIVRIYTQSSDKFKVFGPQSEIDRYGLITLLSEELHPHDLASLLAQDNICVRAGMHCAHPLHRRFGQNASLRMSLGIYNNLDDVKKFIKAINSAKL